MKIMEIIRFRIPAKNMESIHHELMEQISAHQRMHREPEFTVFFHESIPNDLCLCLRYEVDSPQQRPQRLGAHLAACFKQFGDTSLSCWIEYDYKATPLKKEAPHEPN